MNPFLLLTASISALLVFLQSPLPLDVITSIKTIQFPNILAFPQISFQTPAIARYPVSTFVPNWRDSCLPLPALCNTLDAPVLLYLVLDGFVNHQTANVALALPDATASAHSKGPFGLSLARAALLSYIDALVFEI